MSADDLPTTDVDPAIRVHVSPSQASFFAGEQFSVTITFTNIRTPESPKVKNSHKRGVHSISSAPLARPPTSPGIPRPTAVTPVSAPVNNARDIPARKRLIGQVPGKLDMSTVLEQKRQCLLEKSRSLSIDIPAGELFQKSTDSAEESASRYVRAYNEFSDPGAYVDASVTPLAHTTPRTSDTQPRLSASSTSPSRAQTVRGGCPDSPQRSATAPAPAAQLGQLIRVYFFPFPRPHSRDPNVSLPRNASPKVPISDGLTRPTPAQNFLQCISSPPFSIPPTTPTWHRIRTSSCQSPVKIGDIAPKRRARQLKF